MNKYERLKGDLLSHGKGKMKCFGNSMTPILQSGALCTFKKEKKYKVGDIVFCKVKGRYIDAHKITKTHPTRGYLISNNKCYDNGWTKAIFGRVVKAEYPNNESKTF